MGAVPTLCVLLKRSCPFSFGQVITMGFACNATGMRSAAALCNTRAAVEPLGKCDQRRQRRPYPLVSMRFCQTPECCSGQEDDLQHRLTWGSGQFCSSPEKSRATPAIDRPSSLVNALNSST